MSFLVEILVTRKKGIDNPEARAIEEAINSMGYNVAQLSLGKYFLYVSDQKSKKDAEREAKELSDKVLSNFHLETFQVVSVAEYNPKTSKSLLKN